MGDTGVVPDVAPDLNEFSHTGRELVWSLPTISHFSDSTGKTGVTSR